MINRYKTILLNTIHVGTLQWTYIITEIIEHTMFPWSNIIIINFSITVIFSLLFIVFCALNIGHIFQLFI